MDPRQLFFDERHLGSCAYCGYRFKEVGPRAETRDHVPGKVFLDKPYPGDLPVVAACDSCNTAMSTDEEYVACLLECVACGSVDPDQMERSRIAGKLREQPRLRDRLAASGADGPEPGWTPEAERVRNVILRLAQGHIAYELAEPALQPPDDLSWIPLHVLPESSAQAFLSPPTPTVWPEIGSRAFLRAAVEWPGEWMNQWTEVQPKRYSYLVYASDIISVRILLRNYLACEVRWGQSA